MSTSSSSTTRARVLIVEDAPEYQIVVENSLTDEGYDLYSVSTIDAARLKIDAWQPVVVVLDVGLPDGNGVEFCRQIRSDQSAYVLLLTARDTEPDMLAGFAAGADDYLTKPFSPNELRARVRALVRRSGATAKVTGKPTTLQVGCLSLHPDSRVVEADGAQVDLTATEFGVLQRLMTRPTMVFNRSQLIGSDDEHWGSSDHTVNVHIANLRRKLDHAGHAHIDTVRGVGYRLSTLEP